MEGNRSLTLVIMAKAPRPGRAKTRLIPALGAEGAARLARQLLTHTVEVALTSDIGSVEVCTTPAIEDPSWRGVRWPAGLTFSTQGEGDLGERMARASGRVITSGRSVILIGTDCVQMSPELLRRAAERLRSADAFIHPTRDGGYALLGLRRFSPALFRGIPWSTGEVYNLTRERLEALGWSLDCGEVLQDLDEPRDLRHLSRWAGNVTE